MEKLVEKFKATQLKEQFKFLEQHITELSMMFFNQCFEEMQKFINFVSDKEYDDSLVADLLENFLTSCQEKIQQRLHNSSELRNAFNNLLSRPSAQSSKFLSLFLSFLQILDLQNNPSEAAAYYETIQNFLETNQSKNSVAMLLGWLLQNFDLFKLKFLLNCISPLTQQRELYSDVLNWFSTFVAAAVIQHFKRQKYYVDEDFELCIYVERMSQKLFLDYSDFSPNIFVSFLDSSDLTQQILKIFDNCYFKIGDDPFCFCCIVYGLLYILDVQIYENEVSKILIHYMNRYEYMSISSNFNVNMEFLETHSSKFSISSLTDDEQDILIYAVYIFNRCFEEISISHFILLYDKHMQKLVSFYQQFNEVRNNSTDYNSLFNANFSYKLHLALYLATYCKLVQPLQNCLSNDTLPELLQNENLIVQLISSSGELFKKYFIQACIQLISLFDQETISVSSDTILSIGEKYDDQKNRLQKYGMTLKCQLSNYLQRIKTLIEVELLDLQSLVELYFQFANECINNRTIQYHVEFADLMQKALLNWCTDHNLKPIIVVDFASKCHQLSKQYSPIHTTIATFRIVANSVLRCREHLSPFRRLLLETILLDEISCFLSIQEQLDAEELEELSLSIADIIDQFDVSENVKFVAEFIQFIRNFNVQEPELAQIFVRLYRYYIKLSDFSLEAVAHEKLLQLLNATFLDKATDEQFKLILNELRELLIFVSGQSGVSGDLHVSGQTGAAVEPPPRLRVPAATRSTTGLRPVALRAHHGPTERGPARGAAAGAPANLEEQNALPKPAAAHRKVPGASPALRRWPAHLFCASPALSRAIPHAAAAPAAKPAFYTEKRRVPGRARRPRPVRRGAFESARKISGEGADARRDRVLRAGAARRRAGLRAAAAAVRAPEVRFSRVFDGSERFGGGGYKLSVLRAERVEQEFVVHKLINFGFFVIFRFFGFILCLLEF